MLIFVMIPFFHNPFDVFKRKRETGTDAFLFDSLVEPFQLSSLPRITDEILRGLPGKANDLPEVNAPLLLWLERLDETGSFQTFFMNHLAGSHALKGLSKWWRD